MKKQYETPEAKKVEFNYEENVVASGGRWNNDPDNKKCYGKKCYYIPEGCNWVSNRK